VVAESRITKSTKVKPGRVLARLIDSPDEVQRLAAILTAPPYVFRIFTGEAIAEIYASEGGYSGNRFSCMSGHDEEVFDLYAENPEQIGLLVAHDAEGDYQGRVLIYMEGGKPKHHSRRFYMEGELRLLALEWLQAKGITPITPYSSWSLDRTEFDRYPYLDDFEGVGSSGLTDHSPDHVCDQTTGYARDSGRPCTCCGDHTCEEELIYIGDDHEVCQHCYTSEYRTGEDHRGNPYTFSASDVTEGTIVADDCVFADVDECVEEAERIESDFSDITLIRLSDGTIGTEDELQAEGYTQIGEHWTTDARACSEYVIGDDWYALCSYGWSN